MAENSLTTPISEHFYIINQKATHHLKFTPILTNDKNDRNYKNRSSVTAWSDYSTYISHDTKIPTVYTFIIEKMLKSEILKYIHWPLPIIIIFQILDF